MSTTHNARPNDTGNTQVKAIVVLVGLWVNAGQ